MLLRVHWLSARAAACYRMTPGRGVAQQCAWPMSSHWWRLTVNRAYGPTGGPPQCAPRRAHSSPRHACTLHRVLFLHYLHSGQKQAQQGCRGHRKVMPKPANPCTQGGFWRGIEQSDGLPNVQWPGKGEKMASDSVQEENTHYLQCFRKAMNYGSGTLFWLHALCRYYRPSPPARLHCLPRASPVLPAVLPPAISCLRFLTHCFYWLHWYTGYTLSRPHIYQ